MKTLLFLLLAVSSLLPARAQTLPAEWAVQCPAYGRPYSLVVDALGNSYVTGSFSGTLTLGATTLTATQTAPGYAGPQDVFVAKFDPQGQAVWARQFGDGQRSLATQLVVDPVGDLYVTGLFYSYSLQLGAGGPTLYNASNASEGFVTRFSAQTGLCQWAQRFGGPGNDDASGLTLSAGGELFLTARIGPGDADFGSTTLPGPPRNRGLRPVLARLSTGGTWRWAQLVGSFPADSYGTAGVGAPLLDGAGSLYLAGILKNPSLTFGATTLTTTITLGEGGELFLVKYAESGALRWARQASPGGTNDFNLYGNTLTAYYEQGSLYLGGNFQSQTLRLGPLTLTNAGPLVPTTARYYTDGFAARYDTAGTWQWAVRRGTASTDDGIGVLPSRVRPLGLLVTDYGNPGLLAPLDPATGAWGGEVALPPGAIPLSDELGRLFVRGYFLASSFDVGGLTVPGAGGNTPTGYVARLAALPLATAAAATTGPRLQAWPTPGPGMGVWVQGAPAGQAVQVFDVLGRQVGGGTMPASGPLRLSWPGAGLAPGLYVLRSAGQSCRWVVES